MAEPYYGHRSRLYYDDLYTQPENMAEIILSAYDLGVGAINLINDENILKAFDLACDNGCDMKVIATIGKSEIDYFTGCPDGRIAGGSFVLSEGNRRAKLARNIYIRRGAAEY